MHTSEHPSPEALGEYLDGELPAEARLPMARHLEGCEPCRAELDALRTLVAELRRLPRGIPPARDLRAEIRARLEPPATEPLPLRLEPRARPGTAASVWALRYPLAAAAVALIVATSVVTRALVLDPTTAPAAGAPAASMAGPPHRDAPATLVEFRRAERRYVDAIGELEAAVARDRDSLSPETVRILERNLEVIDRAIVEAREALLRDPGNGGLGAMLISAYEHKLDLLRRTRAAADT